MSAPEKAPASVPVGDALAERRESLRSVLGPIAMTAIDLFVAELREGGAIPSFRDALRRMEGLPEAAPATAPPTLPPSYESSEAWSLASANERRVLRWLTGALPPEGRRLPHREIAEACMCSQSAARAAVYYWRDAGVLDVSKSADEDGTLTNVLRLRAPGEPAPTAISAKPPRKPRKKRPPPPVLASNVAAVVRASGQSNTAIGAALDVAASNVSRWRTGKTLPENMAAFAEWCGISEARLRQRVLSPDEITKRWPS